MAVLLKASSAVTVMLKAPPAVAVLGALTVKWVAAAALTVTVAVPVMVLVVVPTGGGISGAGGKLVNADGTLYVLEVDKIEEGLAKLK